MKQSASLVTSSGAVYTVELMLNLLTEHLSQLQVAELSAQPQVKTVRHGQEKEPKGGQISNALPSLVACAIEFMEDSIAEPPSILEIADFVRFLCAN
ncbi:hypothetical protein [Epibacterium ulvae]|uniref:hypothetical protein n=1 Tax=Epibacterium ulvae TaxID=1156985 RepID=UPI002491F4BB|nr:hypothetical protein [Epibacterium ulvae]